MAIGDAPRPSESIEKKVWGEIDRQRMPSHLQESAWTPAKRASYYLNNFYCKLPSTLARTAYEHWGIKNKEERKVASTREHLKKKGSESYSNEDVEEERFKFSQQFLDQTYEEFLDNIDKAISESGVDREKLIEYITIIDDDHHKYDPETELVLLMPVYLKLRETGYTHRDLTQ